MAGAPQPPPAARAAQPPPDAAPAPGLTPEERAAARREKERARSKARYAAFRAAGGKYPSRAERKAATAARTGQPIPQNRPGRPNKVTVATIAAALAKTGGLIGVTAQLLKVERRTVEGYLQRYESLRRARDQAKEQALDHTEWALIKAARAGEPWAVQWFLRYQGRERGYQDVRKTEAESTVRVQVDYTPDALSAGQPTTVVSQLSQVSQLPDGSADSSRYEHPTSAEVVEVVEAEVTYPPPRQAREEPAGGG